MGRFLQMESSAMACAHDLTGRAGTGRDASALRELSSQPVASPLPIAVLVSGGGTNLQALLDTVHGNEVEIVAVASGTAGAPALPRAAERGVETRVFVRGDYPDRGARDVALADYLQSKGTRLVVLAGYMELLGEVFLDRFPGAVINVHPSLLPAFPGLHAVEQALAYGVKVIR